MRSRRIRLAVLPCLVALALPATAGAQAQQGRLSGVAFIGPYCNDDPDGCHSSPYRARVRIETFGFKHVVYSSRRDGRLFVRLSPGTYRVTATQPRGSVGGLSPEPEIVTIAAGQRTPVILDFLAYTG